VKSSFTLLLFLPFPAELDLGRPPDHLDPSARRHSVEALPEGGASLGWKPVGWNTAGWSTAAAALLRSRWLLRGGAPGQGAAAPV